MAAVVVVVVLLPLLLLLGQRGMLGRVPSRPAVLEAPHVGRITH